MNIKESLHDGTCLAFKTQDSIFKYEGNGIKPLLIAVKDHGAVLQNAYAADKIVGKAAALVFAYAGISFLYADTLSVSAKKILEDNNIKYEYGVLTERIINRTQTDVCPMEKLCAEIESPQIAFETLCRKVGV